MERRGGLIIRKILLPPPHSAPSTPELHFIVCEMRFTEEHFKMPHTKCSQSSSFFSLISPKVKTARFFTSLQTKKFITVHFILFLSIFSSVHPSKDISFRT